MMKIDIHCCVQIFKSSLLFSALMSTEQMKIYKIALKIRTKLEVALT